jgi:hypothetical protein
MNLDLRDPYRSPEWNVILLVSNIYRSNGALRRLERNQVNFCLGAHEELVLAQITRCDESPDNRHKESSQKSFPGFLRAQSWNQRSSTKEHSKSIGETILRDHAHAREDKPEEPGIHIVYDRTYLSHNDYQQNDGPSQHLELVSHNAFLERKSKHQDAKYKRDEQGQRALVVEGLHCWFREKLQLSLVWQKARDEVCNSQHEEVPAHHVEPRNPVFILPLSVSLETQKLFEKQADNRDYHDGAIVVSQRKHD